MVLVQLELVELDDLRDLLVEAWLDRAPKRVAATYSIDADPLRRPSDEGRTGA